MYEVQEVTVFWFVFVFSIPSNESLGVDSFIFGHAQMSHSQEQKENITLVSSNKVILSHVFFALQMIRALNTILNLIQNFCKLEMGIEMELYQWL